MVPAAQAVQVAFTGPLSPSRMELQAEAMLGIIMGMKKGLTRVGPLSKRMPVCSMKVSRPPTPEPTSAPTA